MSIHNKAVVIGCKVSPMQKKEVERTAERLEVDVSTYLRSLIAKDHPRLNYLANYPSNLIFQSGQLEDVTSLLQELHQIYPEYSNIQLIIAALRALKANEQMYIKAFKVKNLVP